MHLPRNGPVVCGSMALRFAAFMAHAALLQIVVLVLRVATSYQAIELGLGALGIGLISACFALLPVMLAMPMARVVDQRGDFPVIVGGMGVLVLATLVFVFLSASVAGLVLATMLLGVSHFLALVSQHAFVANTVSGPRQASLFGWYAAAISLGQVVGPGILVLFSSSTTPDLTGLYLVCVPIALAQLPLLLVLRPLERTVKVTSDHRPVAELLRLKGVWKAILTGVAVMAGLDLITIYLPLLGSARGIDASIIAALMTVRAAAALLSRASYGYIVERFDRNLFLALTLVASGLACLGLVVPIPVPLLFPLIAVYGFGLGVALPITLGWITEIAPQGDRGTLISLRQSVLRVCQVLIPVAGGGLAALFGAGSIFAVLAICLVSAGAWTRR